MDNFWQIAGISALVDAVFWILIVIFGMRWYTFRKNHPIAEQPVKLTNMWHTVDVGSERHTLPMVDSIEHEVVRCACSPKRVPGRVDENPEVFWTVIHNATDGRNS